MTRPRAAIGVRGDGRPSEACQREIGVTHYRWRFVNTKRGCRHAEREGQTYSWDEPPTGGHPGAEAGCACSAEAVLPDLDDLRDLIWHGPGPHPQPHPDPTAAAADPRGSTPNLLVRLWRWLRSRPLDD